jgi:AbiV family abortive infection protein
MDEHANSFEEGFLESINQLDLDQLQEALEAAYGNAVALLEEADILRRHERCARAYFLAHIACEELGKLPMLLVTSTSVWLGMAVDWGRLDRALRSHGSKIKQVLFMDSLQGGRGLEEGTRAYEDDIQRMRAYTDMKNASLYSFHTQGHFGEPNEQIPCEMFDSLRRLAEGRRRAFEGYMQPVWAEGGLRGFYSGQWVARANDLLEALLGDKGRAAFEEARSTGDDSSFRAIADGLLPGEAPGDEDWSDDRVSIERQRMKEILERAEAERHGRTEPSPESTPETTEE